ncbi:unnamed protein product [Penicillium camemberti]|uniref:Str. FM013 n=1 Tax=Penicillium camemberti (strain FM 013) TaxID=1429867 RepID=A0A0G4NYR0_PENC3|nr:unnamed protein product [Penicillium camemberti]
MSQNGQNYERLSMNRWHTYLGTSSRPYRTAISNDVPTMCIVSHP